MAFFSQIEILCEWAKFGQCLELLRFVELGKNLYTICVQMAQIDAHIAEAALAATGAALERQWPGRRFRIVLTGGTAGLLAGWFRPDRTTADCDVITSDPDAGWVEVESAARGVAEKLGLPPTWLNRDASNFLWCLPLGWESQCERVGTFGLLDVHRIGRSDLIAAKVVSCNKRPQDAEDLRDLKPTEQEWNFSLANLDRLEEEHLDRQDFETQRRIVNGLRGAS